MLNPTLVLVELVVNRPDDLLDRVLEKGQADDGAVLVDDEGDMGVLVLQLEDQLPDGLDLGDNGSGRASLTRSSGRSSIISAMMSRLRINPTGLSRSGSPSG